MKITLFGQAHEFVNDQISTDHAHKSLAKIQTQVNNREISNEEARASLRKLTTLTRVNSVETVRKALELDSMLYALREKAYKETLAINPDKRVSSITHQRCPIGEKWTESLQCHATNGLSLNKGKGDAVYLGTESQTLFPVGARQEFKASGNTDGGMPSYSPIPTADYIGMAILDRYTLDFQITNFRYADLPKESIEVSADGKRWRCKWTTIEEQLVDKILIEGNLRTLTNSPDNIYIP